MGFFSSVGSFFSGVGSAISSAVSSIGSALSSFAGGIAAVIGTISNALPALGEALGKFAAAFLQGLGILKPNENVEDMGERALQAAEKGITMDKFDNFDTYLEKLRDFEIDPEKAEKRSSAEKLVAGLGVGTVGVERKFNAEPGSLNGMWLLPLTNGEYFTPDRMQNLLQAGRLTGDIFAYLEKRLTATDSRRLEDGFALEKQGPMDNEGKERLYEALDQARDQWADLNKKIDDNQER